MTALLFLHPLGADSSFWDPVIELLPDIEGESIDLPGHGAAALPRAGSAIEDLGEAVARQIVASGSGPRTIVGLSLGGLVALQLGATHPELVDRLVIADSVAVYPELMILMWHQRADTARRGGLHELVEPMVKMWFTDELAQSADDRVTHASKVLASTDPEGYARSCEALAEADLTELVPSITFPTTVVCGTDDAPPFLEAAEWLTRTLPQAELRWIEGARHASAVERPAEFAEIIRASIA